MRSKCTTRSVFSTARFLGVYLVLEVFQEREGVRKLETGRILFREYCLRTKNQPEVFLHKFFRGPFGSRTSAQKTLFSCAPRDGVKVFGPGRPPEYPPERPRDIPPQNFMFRLLSLPDSLSSAASVVSSAKSSVSSVRFVPQRPKGTPEFYPRNSLVRAQKTH